MRDVGDVDSQPVAGVRPDDFDRIVEILSRLAVDRHDAVAAEVAPAEEVLRPHAGREALRFRHDRLGKARRQTVRPEHDLDVDAGLPEKPDPLLDHAMRDPARVGKRRQPCLDDLPFTRAVRLAVRDANDRVDPGIVAEGRAGHYGVPGMRERAKRIGGKLDVWTRTGAGTEIELSIPGSIAYGTSPGRTVLGLFRKKAANS